MLKTTLAKLVTAKVALALAATTACGGAAMTVAATSGNLSVPVLGLHKTKPGRPHTPTVPVVTPGAPQLSVSPSQDLYGLCRAFLISAAGHGEVALRSKEFEVLRRASGGDTVQTRTYCLTLLHHAPTSASTPSRLPSSLPTTPATGDQPSGPPHLPIDPTQRPTLPAHPTLPLPSHPSKHP